MTDPVLLLPRDRLPDDPVARAYRLNKIFPDHAAQSVLCDDRWAVRMQRPREPARLVDERIREGLASWEPGGLELADIPRAVRREPGFQLSLYDSWSLWAWSRWLAGGRGDRPDQVVILHVDQHDDLASPHLWASPTYGWIDALTGLPARVDTPAEIADAIASGAVGIASWLLPFLFAVRRVHMRHLRATVRRASVVGDYRLVRITTPDPDLDPTARRPAVTPVETDATNLPEPPVDLRVTCDIGAFLQDLPDAPILLHIDCDYFNNRYDGNSDWRQHGIHHDPPWLQIEHSIEALFAAIVAAGAIDRVVDITVALSPGFFPAEFWAGTVRRLRQHISATTRIAL
jgi:hypothetical protein